MHKDAYTENQLSNRYFLTFMVVLILLTVISCRGGGEKHGINENVSDKEEFHADNDIAMTIRSLADAIKVGEPLDSTEYDFLGVLTDGQGAPLYTDVQGSPGIWVIDVIDNKNVSIRNLYLGDLLPGDLETYIIQSLSLSEESLLEFETPDAAGYDDTSIRVYDFGGGYLRFEIRSGIAPNGLEGPLLTIILSAKAPAGSVIS